MKRRAIGYYDYTVVLTYCGMLSAFYGILCAIGGHYSSAVVCLMVAGVCDMFDGAVAATKDREKSEKRFGIQIDSLSDLISFGVLPGIFTYMISGQKKLVGLIAALFVLCALIRLAYYNVLEEERQNETTEKRKNFLGVPVTTIAVLLPIVFLLFDRNIFKNPVCFPILLAVLGVGFVTPVEIKKPGALGKICILVIGFFEILGVLLFMGWDVM